MKNFYKLTFVLGFLIFGVFSTNMTFAAKINQFQLSIPLDGGKEAVVTTHSEPEFDDSAYFPGKQIDNFQGLGTKGNSHAKGESQMLIYYIPTLTNLLLWIIAPLVVAMFLYAGVQFIYAGDDEEQLTASKKFFQYGIMGIIFIFVSYSLMAAVYNIIAK